MNEINTERIKALFNEKLEAEKIKTRRRKFKWKTALIAAAIFSLMSVSVLATGNRNGFDFLFNNEDLTEYVQTPDIYVENGGIIMNLTSYLADMRGMLVELTFTNDDGSPFPEDIIIEDFWATGMHEGMPVPVSWSVRQGHLYSQDALSPDGLEYHALVVTHFETPMQNKSWFDLRINRLSYNLWESVETANFNLYDRFSPGVVRTSQHPVSMGDMWGMFMWDLGAFTLTDLGVGIRAVNFARLKAPEDECNSGRWTSYEYNYIVVVTYRTNHTHHGREYRFRLVPPPNATFISSSVSQSSIERYSNSRSIFRLNSFEDLGDIRGLDFEVSVRNYIEGNWFVRTEVDFSREVSSVELNMPLELPPDPPYDGLNKYLSRVDVSLFSTMLVYEFRLNDGSPVTNRHLRSDFSWGTRNHEISLLYRNGDKITLYNPKTSVNRDHGRIYVTYAIDMHHINYTIMNTSDLVAIVINGVEFPV